MKRILYVIAIKTQVSCSQPEKSFCLYRYYMETLSPFLSFSLFLVAVNVDLKDT